MEIVWFEGNQYPHKLSDILAKDTLFRDEDDDYDDEKVTCSTSYDEEES